MLLHIKSKPPFARLAVFLCLIVIARNEAISSIIFSLFFGAISGYTLQSFIPKNRDKRIFTAIRARAFVVLKII
ncbi:multisubunit Na+/H+ antiporter MnhE subunit [Flavobacterium sp. CG_9.10]|nr:multisubunit Na+/H+ antiporter MnhE subunit [Flavobacterium sp. CG_9.10]